MRCPERLTPGWCTAVHGGVNQYLLDLVDRYACSDRTLHIDAQLVGPPKRRQDREVQHAPCLVIQTWPAPGVPPRPLSHDALEGHHELVGVSEVRVDVLGAQDIPAALEGPSRTVRSRPWRATPFRVPAGTDARLRLARTAGRSSLISRPLSSIAPGAVQLSDSCLPLASGCPRPVFSAYLSGHGSMINGKALS